MKKVFSKKKALQADLLLFSLPALCFVLLSTLIPFVMNMYYALYKWDGISKTKTFVGIQNFVRIFTVDKTFQKSVFFTWKFTIAYVLVINIVAIIVAYALANNMRINYIFRSFYFVPHIISLVAISLIWKCILGPGFNNLYETTGMKIFGIGWLSDSKAVFFTVVAVALWQNIGYYMVIYIAGFTSIPSDVLEAAEVDGATGIKRMLRIQIPLLMPSITIAVFSSLTYSFKLFDIILVLTKGGPADSTTTIAYNIYKEAFTSGSYGLATAKSLVFFVMVLIVTAIQLRYFKAKEVNY